MVHALRRDANGVTIICGLTPSVDFVTVRGRKNCMMVEDEMVIFGLVITAVNIAGTMSIRPFNIILAFHVFFFIFDATGVVI